VATPTPTATVPETPTASATPTPPPTGRDERLLLRPGTGLDGILFVNTHRYSDVKTRMTMFFEAEEAAVPERTFSRIFAAADWRLRAQFSDSNFSRTLDDRDLLLSITALPAGAGKGDYPGVTAEGLGIGSTRAEVEAVEAFAQPDRVLTLPAVGEFAGGTFGFYFGLGGIFGYDAQGAVTNVTVTRVYAQAPDGAIDFEGGRLDFGGGRVITAGDCAVQQQLPPSVECTGSSEAVHRGILGSPDYSGTQMLQTQAMVGGNQTAVTLTLSLDFYQVLGMQFTSLKRVEVGTAVPIRRDVDAVVALAVFPPYYGVTAQGIGIGSARADLEAQLGWSDPVERTGPSGERLFVYVMANGKKAGVAYFQAEDAGPQRAGGFLFPFPEQDVPAAP
jgi:hypothetical protein